jgi:hypothetical protein
VLSAKNNIGIQKSGSGGKPSFNGVSGKTYKLQRAENIEDVGEQLATIAKFGIDRFEDKSFRTGRFTGFLSLNNNYL